MTTTNDMTFDNTIIMDCYGDTIDLKDMGDIFDNVDEMIDFINNPEKYKKKKMKENCKIICGNPPCKNEGIKKCSICKTLKYCGKKCQREDWHRHKPKCNTYKDDGSRVNKVKKGSNKIKMVVFENQHFLNKKILEGIRFFVYQKNKKIKCCKISDYKRVLSRRWDKQEIDYHIRKILDTKQMGIYNVRSNVSLIFHLEKIGDK